MQSKELDTLINNLLKVFSCPLNKDTYKTAFAELNNSLQNIISHLYQMSDKWATKHLQNTLDTLISYYNFEKWRAATNGTYNKECVYDLDYTTERWKIEDEAEREHQDEIYRWRIFQDLVFCAVAEIVDFADEAEITLNLTNADTIDETQEYFAVCEFAPTCDFAELPTFAHDITHDPESQKEANEQFAELLKKVTIYTATDEATAPQLEPAPDDGAPTITQPVKLPTFGKYTIEEKRKICETFVNYGDMERSPDGYKWTDSKNKTQIALFCLCFQYGTTSPKSEIDAIGAGERDGHGFATACENYFNIKGLATAINSLRNKLKKDKVKYPEGIRTIIEHALSEQ